MGGAVGAELGDDVWVDAAPSLALGEMYSFQLANTVCVKIESRPTAFAEWLME